MNKRVKLICIFIAFIFLFISCNKDKNKESTSSTSRDVSSIQDTEDILSSTTTTAQSTNGSEAAVAATTLAPTLPSETLQESTIYIPIEYNTIKDIVSLYNECANYIKPKSKVATRNYQNIKPLSESNSSGTLSKVIQDNICKASTTEPLKCNTYELKKENFPVSNEDYASKLKPDMVKSASCSYKDGKYNLIIELKDDPNDTQDYSSTCLSVISPKIIAQNANTSLIKEENIKANCKGCIIKASIDEQTLYMTDLYYKMPTYLSAEIAGTNNTFAFYVEQDWTISW